VALAGAVDGRFGLLALLGAGAVLLPRTICGVAGLAGGATRTCGAGAEPVVFTGVIWRAAAMEMGRPPLDLMAAWRCVNDGGAGGGAEAVTAGGS